MGASGSGKTTLLSVISRRFEPALLYKGKIRYAGEEYNIKKHGRRSIAFVRQDDLVLEYLTVAEQLAYSARLRLDLPAAERKERIEQVCC
jgi:ABC-type multidrug transport system ATPase subunit